MATASRVSRGSRGSRGPRVSSGYIADDQVDFTRFGMSDEEIARAMQDAEHDSAPQTMESYLAKRVRTASSTPVSAPAPAPARPAPVFERVRDVRPSEVVLVHDGVFDNLYSWASVLIPDTLPFSTRHRLESAIVRLIRSYSALGYNRLAIQNEIRSLIEDAEQKKSGSRTTTRPRQSSKTSTGSRTASRTASRTKSVATRRKASRTKRTKSGASKRRTSRKASSKK